jgi:hypothetical protein
MYEKENKNLIKIAVPELDLGKYKYSKHTIRQIKTIFREFYDNRVLFLDEQKRKIKKDKKTSVDSSNDYMRQTFVTSSRLRQSADNFRRRIYEEIEREILNKPEYEMEKNTEFFSGEKKTRKLKLEEVYHILKKKKEK